MARRQHGDFRGTIRGTGTLMVGPQAKIEVDINAARVVISDQMAGDITTADQRAWRSALPAASRATSASPGGHETRAGLGSPP